MPEKTSEKSLDDLRSKGVTVETPESRIAEKKLISSLNALKLGDPNTRSFKYVLIPADSSKPAELKTAVVPAESFGQLDLLVHVTKPHFSEDTSIDVDSLKKSANKSLVANETSFNGKKISLDDLARRAAVTASTEGAVETFKLGKTENFYLDEVGAFKSLAKNERASFIAAQCGYGDVPFFGDIFFGRVAYENGNIVNKDVKLEDIDVKDISKMSWTKEAVEFNHKSQRVRQEAGMNAGMDADEVNTKGGEGEGFVWVQTPDDVEITFQLQKDKGEKIISKAVKVIFKTRSLEVSYNSVRAFYFEKLFSSIVADESTWSIVDGNLVVTLNKAKQGMVWSTIS